MRVRLLAAVLAAVTSLGALALPASATPPTQDGVPTLPARPHDRVHLGEAPAAAGKSTTALHGAPALPKSHEVVVQLARGASVASIAKSVGGSVGRVRPNPDTVVIDTDGADPATVATQLEKRDDVVFAEPNLPARILAVPNDPSYVDQAAAFDLLRIPTAWQRETGKSTVTVAVLDTGVDLDHPDFAGRLVAGYDYVNGDTTPDDDNGHGTMVAGLIGAVRNNGTNISGVAGGGVKIMPVKVANVSGLASSTNIANGINFAANHGAKVINISIGGPGSSGLVDTAVANAEDKGVLIVAAAGNDGAFVDDFPAGSEGVMGVGATDDAGQYAWFSTYGYNVDVVAPGVNVTSTAKDGGVTVGSGTSFASPIVAGVAALVRSEFPSWGWERTQAQLIQTARDAGISGVDDQYGAGIVDAAAALGIHAKSPLVGLTTAALDTEPNDVPSHATVATDGDNTGVIGTEGDIDWWTYTAPSDGSLTVTVTPPPTDENVVRALELDPVVELYTDGHYLQTIDETRWGEAETATVAVTAGTNQLSISNYFASRSPGDYTLNLAFTPGSGPGILFTAGPWVLDSTPLARATGVSPTANLTVAFGHEMVANSIDDFSVALFQTPDYEDYQWVDATVTYSSPTHEVTIDPTSALPGGTPFQLAIFGPEDTNGDLLPYTVIPFTTSGSPFTKLNQSGTGLVPLSADLLGDTTSEILWYGAGTKTDPLWGGFRSGFDNFGDIGVNPTFRPFTGDFDGNGLGDVFWYGVGSKPDTIWFTTVDEVVPVNVTVNGTYTPFVGDFNGDSYDDVFWYTAGTAADWIWYGTKTRNSWTKKSVTVDKTYRPAVTDANGDGKDDILWHGPGTAADAQWNGSSTGFVKKALTISGNFIPVGGDFDGDGYGDLMMFGYGTNGDAFWKGSAAGFVKLTRSVNSTAKPVMGDWNGDGYDDLYWYASGTATDSVWLGQAAGF